LIIVEFVEYLGVDVEEVDEVWMVFEGYNVILFDVLLFGIEVFDWVGVDLVVDVYLVCEEGEVFEIDDLFDVMVVWLFIN